MAYSVIIFATLFWLLQPVSYGQPAISNLAADDISYASARVSWQASPASNRQVAFDTLAYFQANGSYRYRTGRRNHYSTQQLMNLTGLAPGTQYAACPLVCDASGNCRGCGVSDPSVTFTTLPEPAVTPQMPAMPNLTGFDTTYPAVQATLEVAADCSDLPAKLFAASGSAYNNITVEIVIPAGTVCTPAPGVFYEMRAKQGSGWIVIRSSAADKLPPPGIRVTPDYKQYMATFQSVTTNGSALDMAPIVPAHHFRFVGIEFTHIPRANPDDVVSTLQRYVFRADVTGMNNIVFDRCYIHGRGYPDRVGFGFYGRGDNLAFLDSYISNIDAWRAYQSGISVTRPNASTNNYSSGTIYFGNTSLTINPFSVSLSGSGSGVFRLYFQRNGSIAFKHNVAGLTANCNGCTAIYEPALTVPDDAFKFNANDDTGNNAITSGQFRTAGGAPTGTPWAIQDEREVGLTEGSVGLYFDATSNRIVVRNNYIGATGIGFFIEQENGVNSADVDITGNTFQSDPNLFVPIAGASNRIGFRRQHIEFKQGERIRIEGNQFLDAWVGVSGNSSAAVQIANRANGTPFLSGMRDITIRNNFVKDHPMCFWVRGMEPSGLASKLTRRVLIDNNICQANARIRKNYYIQDFDSAVKGYSNIIEAGGEDVSIRHNTFYDVRGYGPMFLKMSDLWMAGLSVKDNIFFFHNDNNYSGARVTLDYDYVNHIPAITGGEGTTALNQFSRRMGENFPGSPDWTFTNNVIVAGCNNSGDCGSDTTNLVNPSSKQSIYPPGNFWVTGSTFGQRLGAINLNNPAADDFRMLAGSPYRSGAANAASDGGDVGVRQDDLEAAIGRMGEVTRDAGSDSAVLNYQAYEGGPCYIEYGTSDVWGTGIRVSDSGDRAKVRNVVLANLTPDTSYFFRVLCKSERRTGQFTTGGVAAAANHPVSLAAPPNRGVQFVVVDYGPTSLLGSSTAPIVCPASCGISIPATSNRALFYRVNYLTASQQVTAKGTVRAVMGR